jgi:hypothetical protein
LDAPQIWQVIEDAEEFAGGAGGQLPPVRLSARAVIEDVRTSFLHDRSTIPEWMFGEPDRADHTGWLMYKLDEHPVVWAARALEVVMHDSFPPGPLCQVIDTLRRAVDPCDREQLVAERTAQCDLVRDIFGNPFRTTSLSPEWRTDTAVSLARMMYAAREFSAMPILADALQDAGCDNDDILSHCRGSNQVHVRGCWVCDLVLGKE